jgi:hypothetical protein
MIRAGITRLLQGPPITGWAALLVTAGALAIPTGVRAAMTGVVTGCEFTPYLPFVLLTAILVGWRQAAAVAIASAAILGGVIVGQPNAPFDKSCFISGAGIFLAASAMILGIIVAARHAGRNTDESTGGIRFSLDQGDVWASWYGQSPPVRLGSQRSVAEMMEDFLSQSERGNSSDPS